MHLVHASNRKFMLSTQGDNFSIPILVFIWFYFSRSSMLHPNLYLTLKLLTVLKENECCARFTNTWVNFLSRAEQVIEQAQMYACNLALFLLFGLPMCRSECEKKRRQKIKTSLRLCGCPTIIIGKWRNRIRNYLPSSRFYFSDVALPNTLSFKKNKTA